MVDALQLGGLGRTGRVPKSSLPIRLAPKSRLDGFTNLGRHVPVHYVGSDQSPSSSSRPKGAIPRARDWVKSSVPALDEITQNGDVTQTGTLSKGGKKKEVKKLDREYPIVIAWTGGEVAYGQLVTKLRGMGLWIGLAKTKKNVTLMKSFCVIRYDKSNKKRNLEDPFIQFKPEDCLWWAQHRLDLGVRIPWSNDSHGPNKRLGGVRDQIYHFIDSVVTNRYDKNSALEYEQSAAQVGAKPWSGKLVEDIVKEAWHLQPLVGEDGEEEDEEEGTDQAGKVAEKSGKEQRLRRLAIRQARDQVLARWRATVPHSNNDDSSSDDAFIPRSFIGRKRTHSVSVRVSSPQKGLNKRHRKD